MALVIALAGVTLLLISLYWYWSTRQLLMGQRSILSGATEGPQPTMAVRRSQIDLHGLWVGTAGPLLREVGDAFGGQTVAYRVRAGDVPTPGRRIIELPSSVDESHSINRILSVIYSKAAYVNRAFYLIVRIGAEGRTELKLSEEEQHDLKEVVSGERLQFATTEAEPIIQVELKFTEGDFAATKTQDQKKLETHETTEFRFLLKPLKGEHCAIAITISYLSTEMTEEHVIQRAETTTRRLGDTEATEQSEETTWAPASRVSQTTEIRTIELWVAVKTIFGLDSTEVVFLQKGFGVVAAAVVLALTIFMGRVTGPEGVGLAIVALADIVGVPVADAVAKRLDAPAGDNTVTTKKE